jgi:DNA-binding NarL/FixJ family response regulator
MTEMDVRAQKILELLRDGRSDRRIARHLGISTEEVRASIDAVIAAAHLEEGDRVEALAERVGIIRHNDNF